MTMTAAHHSERVRPEWIDYNGHLSEPYYILVLGHATDVLMDRVGLDAGYRARTACSLYTVEAHVRYLREVGPHARLDVVTRVLAVDAKRAHAAHEMYVDGTLVATEELLGAHVDGRAGRSSPFPANVRNALEELVEPSPAYARRAIAMPRPDAGVTSRRTACG